jgi:hypothetical protein
VEDIAMLFESMTLTRMKMEDIPLQSLADYSQKS